MPAAIESVLNQTHQDVELVIVDDGSTDQSQTIIDEYAKRDGRIVPIIHSNNMGVSRAMNDGIRASKGELICFLGSDDIYTEDKLELQISALGSKRDQIAYCDWFSISKDGTTSRQEHKLLEENGFIFPSLLRRSIIVNALVMIPRSCLNSLGRLFDESLQVCEDYDLLLALSQRFSFVYVPKPLYGYRLYEGNVSSTVNRRWRYAQKAKVIRRYITSPVLTRTQRIEAYENLVMCDIASRSYGKIVSEVVTNRSYLIALSRALSSALRAHL